MFCAIISKRLYITYLVVKRKKKVITFNDAVFKKVKLLQIYSVLVHM